MVDSRASCFLLKNFFRHFHEHCCYLSLFCFSDTFGFLENGSWSHDKLSAPYFVPCCTENISIIEIDHSLHCHHWKHFTKRLWEKSSNYNQTKIIAHSQNQTSFFRRNWDSFFLFDMATPPRRKFLIKVDETECRWAKCARAPSEGNSVGASGVPLRALSSKFVVLSSASERPETELFQCRCSLGVFVTEDSSVNTKRGKLSVEMTDQSLVTKWTICLQTRSFFFARKTTTLAPQTLL